MERILIFGVPELYQSLHANDYTIYIGIKFNVLRKAIPRSKGSRGWIRVTRPSCAGRQQESVSSDASTCMC